MAAGVKKLLFLFVSKEKSITFASPLEKDASMQERFVSKQHIVITPCLYGSAVLNYNRSDCM